MNDIQAAIGLAQLKKLDPLNEKRRQIVKHYNQAFADLGWLETPVEKDYARSANHNYVVKLDRRDEFISYLQERGISASVHYLPNHLYSMFRKFKADVPITERVWKRIVTLPLYPDLTPADIQKIIEVIRDFGKWKKL
jgi:perosamine synthetase